jgi:EAL domain-containing protein (putative c-di-GMP-specific phosphodiesterase class I)
VTVGDTPEAALRRAIAEDAISLAYQPKLEIGSGRVVGVEALARWTDGDRGPQDPSVFIPLAEQCGLIGAITEAGIRTALRQWLSWREQGIVLGIAYNISPLLLGDLEFPDRLERLCIETGVAPEHLTLELTEGATQHVVHLMDTLTRLRIKGIRAAIDDFGTGYSSLLQLRQLPFNELKIDQWFVTDSTRSPDSALIIHSIIDLAHGLGMSVTAEGVASEAEFDLLARYGCDRAQGELVAMAMPGDALAPWLLDNGPKWRERRQLERTRT